MRSESKDNVKKLGLLSMLLPYVVGCGGGSGSASVGSLFGGATASSAAAAAEGANLLADGGSTVGNTITNPEPATLLLLGAGVVAMGYLRKRTSLKR